MAQVAAEKKEKRQRSPKAGKRITVTLTDEHYAAIDQLAKANERNEAQA